MVLGRGMTIVLTSPRIADMPEVVTALRECQREGATVQLHPGDLGWFWRLGTEATVSATRAWSRDGRILAVGLLDETDVLRLGVVPDAQRDAELAQQLAVDVTEPRSGVLPEGKVFLEARQAPLLQAMLREQGWVEDAPWTPLRRELADPVEDPGLRIDAVGPEQVSLRTTVQRAAFDRSTFTDERWHLMAGGLPYADARCLLARDDHGDPVAAVTVWSAGPGRPGLLEPMGVHRDHRGRGHGRAITLAAAATLRELGSSSAVVVTPTSNAGGIATYVAAGFTRLADAHDLRRDA